MMGQTGLRCSLALAAVALIVGPTLSGCDAQNDLLIPGVPPADHGPPIQIAGTEVETATKSAGVEVKSVDWELVKEGLVTPDEDVKLDGSRYSLTFARGSVNEPTVITIHEHSPLIADVEFGPSGLQFEIPVEVTISYANTAVDCSSPNYRGLPLGVFWYNPDTEDWEPLPYTKDAKLKLVHFTVDHFSRYGLTDATKEGEWQWSRSRHGRRLENVTSGKLK